MLLIVTHSALQTWLAMKKLVSYVLHGILIEEHNSHDKAIWVVLQQVIWQMNSIKINSFLI